MSKEHLSSSITETMNKWRAIYIEMFKEGNVTQDQQWARLTQELNMTCEELEECRAIYWQYKSHSQDLCRFTTNTTVKSTVNNFSNTINLTFANLKVK